MTLRLEFERNPASMTPSGNGVNRTSTFDIEILKEATMRRDIPRSPRTLRKIQQRQMPEPKPSRWEKALKTGPFIVSLSGLFVSLTAMLLTMAINGPTLIKNAKDLSRWYLTDQDASGRWNNSSEYDISPPSWATSEEDAVFLDVKAYRGEVSGMAVSQRMCKYSPRTDVFVEGRISGDHGLLIFWDYVFGVKKAFAKANFRINRTDGLLDVEVIEQAPDLFPSNFRVHKLPDFQLTEDDGDDSNDARLKDSLKEASKLEQARYRGAICKEFSAAIQEATKRARERSQTKP